MKYLVIYDAVEGLGDAAVNSVGNGVGRDVVVDIQQYLITVTSLKIAESIPQHDSAVVVGFLGLRKHPAFEEIRRNVTLTGGWPCRQTQKEGVIGSDQADPFVPGAQEGFSASGVGATRVVVELNEDVVEELGGDGFAEIGDRVCEALRGCRQVKPTARRLSEEVEFPCKVVPVILRLFNVEVDAVQLHASQWTVLPAQEVVVQVFRHLLCVVPRAQGVV